MENIIEKIEEISRKVIELGKRIERIESALEKERGWNKKELVPKSDSFRKLEEFAPPIK